MKKGVVVKLPNHYPKNKKLPQANEALEAARREQFVFVGVVNIA